MARRKIHWPWAGRSDSSATSEQPEFTTRSARNVRNRDCVSGRIRGASASGAVKWNPNVIGAGRVRALCSTSIDTRKLEFDFTAGQEDELWSAATPSKLDCLEGRVDGEGNVYAVDGNASIVKFNSTGKQVMTVALPVADQNHVVRALCVDESFRIFAAVSAGGDVATARVWCIIQLQDNEYHILWTLEPGAYTEALRVHRGTQLFAAHNYTTQNRSRVIVYEGIGIDPVEASRVESVAFPINDMDVIEDGSLYTASQPTTAAVQRPAHPGVGNPSTFHQRLVIWTPNDLTDAKKRIWSWYDAGALDETDLEQTGDEPEMRDGQQVLRWRDISGNGRHFYAGNIEALSVIETAAEKGPGFVTVGIGGHPSIRFKNFEDTIPAVDVLTKQSLATLRNSSIEANVANQQRTALPTYKGAQFCLFMVLRPYIDPDATTSPRGVLAQENQHATASDHVLFVDRTCGTVLPGTYNQGEVSYYATTDNTGDAGQCAGPVPQSLGYDFQGDVANAAGVILVTILWDGGVSPNDASAGTTRCLVRYNGVPVDRFEGLPLESLLPTWLGLVPATIMSDGLNPARRYNGEIGEMLVLVRKDLVGTTEPKVASFDAFETGVAGANQTDNEITQIEAYLAYKWGIGGLFKRDIAPGAGFPHFYGVNTNILPSTAVALPGPPAAAGGKSNAHRDVLFQDGVVTKHDALGTLRWAASNAFTGTTADTIGGIGYGVRARKVESDGLTHVWSAGPDSIANLTDSGNVALRKLIDLGASGSILQADGAWVHRFSGNADFDYAYPRMASDKFGNLYVPGYHTGGGTMRPLHVFAKDPTGGGDATQITEFLLAGSSSLAHAVALPPDALTPDYRGDLATELAERVYVFTKVQPDESVYAIQLVSTSALLSGNPEEIVTIAVSEDDIRLVTASTNTVPTGGSAAVSATAQFIQALRAGEDIVVLDGEKVMAYKLRDGTVERLEATSSGEVPRGGRARYAAFWRHRLVLALEGGLYAASRLGNIRDWNLNPGSNIAGVPLQTATQAFTGTITRAGEAEDSIVTMIPAADDLLFLVGSSRILRLTGDPQDGGQIHLVTESMGGVFGNSWCKDDRGRIFMWGNKPPGLYQVREVGDPVPLSSETLEATEFEEIDFATHRIELVWDPIERTVRIFQVAWDDASIVSHWAWEEKTHRLVRVPPVWQDRIESAEKQPTAFTYLGGDDTRALLVGCADGYIRRFDPEARDFDGTAVDSLVVIELTAGLPEGRAWLLTDVEVVLADDQEGCRLELFAGETADNIGPILASIDLKPGRNEPFGARVAGAHIWMRLRSAKVGRWAFEEASVNLEPFGMQRQSRT